MKIKTFFGGYDKNLSYLVWCESTQIAGIIDASVDPSEIIEYIDRKDLILEKLFITHTHFDHIKYIDKLTLHFPLLQICGHINPEKKISNDYRGLEDYQIVTLGTELITILYTPGHYPDSICFWNTKERALFTGDTMFVGRTGRTIGSKSNIAKLYASIYDKVLKLSSKTQIYPGHHYGFKKSISLIDNIRLSPFFQCKSLSEFTMVMENYEKIR
jgi:glyoxylase-like metal-dependent hydrolase (beta-lactamase superfamily II)